MINKGKKNRILFETSRDFDNITDEDVTHFKSTYSILDDVDLQFQEMTINKSLSYKGKEYFVGEIDTPLNVFVNGATYMHNGIPGDCPKSHIYQEETTEEIITVVKDLQQEITSVTIINKEHDEIIELSAISPGTFATVQENDYDYDNINAKFAFGGQEEDNLERRLSNIAQEQRQASSSTCSSYTALEIALAYESSFCREMGGRAAADQKALSIIADVATKFKQQNLCVQLQVSHLEGYCDSKSDPYKEGVDLRLSGCGNTGLLDEVREYWNQNRQTVHRDAMHLFTGTGFDCSGGGCTIGCAYTRTICSESNAYGVNHVTYTSSTNLQAVLVAHELGHTCGANHYDDESGYIMNARIGSGQNGFSSQSLDAMNFAFSRTSCITEARAPTPQPISSAPTSSPLKENESLQQLNAQFSFEMQGISPAQSPINENNMESVIETGLANTLDDMIIKETTFKKFIIQGKDVYKVSFKSYETAICADDCTAAKKDFTERVEDKVADDSFISEIKNAAEIYQVSHLFRNAEVVIDTFSSVEPVILPFTSAPSASPTPPIVFEGDVNEKGCRNSLPSVVQNVAKSLFGP